MHVLICTQTNADTHVDSVCRRLKKLGATPVVLERYRKDHFVSLTYSKNKHSLLVKTEEGTYDLLNDNFISVWWRLKPVISAELPGNNAPIEEQFSMHEWRKLLYSLPYFLPHLKWINDPFAKQKIDYKPIQLKLAQECGLLIPETLITNNQTSAENFVGNGRCIYKTLSSFISDTKAIYTTEINQKQIQSSKDALTIAPCLFQPLIEKKHELRVTVVGKKVFTVKIDSQRWEDTKIDWRHSDRDEMFVEGQLSKETESKLLKFHEKANLVYAAYDFIVDKQNREIFLECNSSGQWLWLESIPGISVSDAVANALL